MSGPDFAKGATGAREDAGLGLDLALSYLGSAKATASLSGSSTAGTSFPATPTDGQEYTYVADATNGVLWKFRWYATGNFWAFVGGPPLYSEVTAAESTTSTTYAALTTPGPSIVLPFAGDYDVEIGAQLGNDTNGDTGIMSYDIGGTGAVDADFIRVVEPGGANSGRANVARRRRKTGLAAVTLTAKYKTDTAVTSCLTQNRWMAVWPVKK